MKTKIKKIPISLFIYIAMIGLFTISTYFVIIYDVIGYLTNIKIGLWGVFILACVVIFVFINGIYILFIKNMRSKYKFIKSI